MSIDNYATSEIATRGRATRFVTYIAEMFPPLVMVPFAAAHFFAIWYTLQALGGDVPVRTTGTSIRGIATVTLFMLLMRLYDELKDAETDIVLGRAGDPLYRDRALVTGAVRIEDVKMLRWLVTAALIAINLAPGLTWASLAFWVLFAVGWLSFRWFFWPAMSQHLLVAFVTHNPISLLLSAYVVALFVDAFGTDRLGTSVVPLLLGLWFPIAAWETSRKVRAPEDETTYRTYSLVLGWKTAAILPAIFAVGSTALLLLVARSADLGALFPLSIAIACGIVVFRCGLFRLSPSRRYADLKPWAMLFTTVANFGLAAGVVVRHGVAW